MDKVKEFEKELNFIKNPDIKRFANKAVELTPDYLYHVAASSSGRYHPQYAQGDGGLLRHTKCAVRIAIELLNLKMFPFTEDEKDLIIVSLILHDCQKHDLPSKFSNFSISTHPIIAADWLNGQSELKNIISDNYLNLILENIRHHMGEFVFDYKTKVKVLEEPQTKMQNFVFMCDYLASRKLLEANFEAETVRK